MYFGEENICVLYSKKITVTDNIIQFILFFIVNMFLNSF